VPDAVDYYAHRAINQFKPVFFGDDFSFCHFQNFKERFEKAVAVAVLKKQIQKLSLLPPLLCFFFAVSE
jgi:hypothetical protein